MANFDPAGDDRGQKLSRQARHSGQRQIKSRDLASKVGPLASSPKNGRAAGCRAVQSKKRRGGRRVRDLPVFPLLQKLSQRCDLSDLCYTGRLPVITLHAITIIAMMSR